MIVVHCEGLDFLDAFLLHLILKVLVQTHVVFNLVSYCH